MKLSKNYCKTFQGLQELSEHNRFAAVHSILQRLPMLLRYFFHCSCLPARCLLVPWRLSTSVTQKSDSSCPKATCCWSTSLTRGAWQIGPEWIWGAALGFDNRTLRFFAHAFHFWFHWLLLIPSWYPHVVIGATNDMQAVELFFHHHDIHQQHHHVGTNCVCALQITSVSFLNCN